MPALSHLKPLILSGEIITFDDIFEHASVNEVARAIGRSPEHIQTVRKDYLKMTFGDMKALAEAVGVHWSKVAELCVE